MKGETVLVAIMGIWATQHYFQVPRLAGLKCGLAEFQLNNLGLTMIYSVIVKGKAVKLAKLQFWIYAINQLKYCIHLYREHSTRMWS